MLIESPFGFGTLGLVLSPDSQIYTYGGFPIGGFSFCDAFACFTINQHIIIIHDTECRIKTCSMNFKYCCVSLS